MGCISCHFRTIRIINYIFNYNRNRVSAVVSKFFFETIIGHGNFDRRFPGKELILMAIAKDFAEKLFLYHGTKQKKARGKQTSTVLSWEKALHFFLRSSTGSEIERAQSASRIPLLYHPFPSPPKRLSPSSEMMEGDAAAVGRRKTRVAQGVSQAKVWDSPI